MFASLSFRHPANGYHVKVRLRQAQPDLLLLVNPDAEAR